MTQANIRKGGLICQIGIALVAPSEFVLYRVCIRLNSLQRSFVTAMITLLGYDHTVLDRACHWVPKQLSGYGLVVRLRESGSSHS
jgi:hypothetical protein